MNEGEVKFKNDINNLILRALRAGASLDSVEMVLQEVFTDLEKSRPYIRAIYEQGLAP